MKFLKAQLILFICLFGFASALQAQISFSHSLGLGLYAGGDAGSPALVYSPRLNIVELSDELSLSIGTHLGGWLSVNSRSGAGALVLDAPLMAEVNFGTEATPGSFSSFGGFAGVGYGFSSIASDTGFGIAENIGTGPVFNAGLRFYLFEVPIGLRFSYMLNTDETYDNAYSASLSWLF